MQKSISNSIRNMKSSLVKRNQESANDPDTINPPARKIVMTGKQRGKYEAWGYARGRYESGLSLESM